MISFISVLSPLHLSLLHPLLFSSPPSRLLSSCFFSPVLYHFCFSFFSLLFSFSLVLTSLFLVLFFFASSNLFPSFGFVFSLYLVFSWFISSLLLSSHLLLSLLHPVLVSSLSVFSHFGLLSSPVFFLLLVTSLLISALLLSSHFFSSCLVSSLLISPLLVSSLLSFYLISCLIFVLFTSLFIAFSTLSFLSSLVSFSHFSSSLMSLCIHLFLFLSFLSEPSGIPDGVWARSISATEIEVSWHILSASPERVLGYEVRPFF